MCVLLGLFTLGSVAGAMFFGGLSTWGEPAGSSPYEIIGPVYSLWFSIPFALWLIYLTVYFIRKK